MTPEQVKETLQKYSGTYSDYKPVRAQPDESGSHLSRDERLQHVRWMCIEAQNFVDQGKIEKAMR